MAARTEEGLAATIRIAVEIERELIEPRRDPMTC